MPTFDRATWRLKLDGLVGAAARALLRRAARAAEGRAGVDLPLRHRLDRQRRPLGRRALPRPARAARGRCRARTPRTSSPPRSPTTTTSTLDDLALPDVMLAYEMDGQPLPAGARRAGAGRDPGHVRLQERQVGRADHARPQAGRGLLGAARLRRQRLGRATPTAMAEATTSRRRARTGARATSSASRSPSGSCTGCTRARSSSCSARA